MYNNCKNLRQSVSLVGMEGRCRVVTCSGAQKDSSLRLVRDQIEVKELVCLILAFNFFWTSAFCSHTDTHYLFLSYASGEAL